MASSTLQLPVLKWAAGVLLVGGVVFDALAPHQYTGDPFFTAACVLTGATQTLRLTLAVCAAAVVAMVALCATQGQINHPVGVTDIVSVSLAALMAVGVNRVLHRYGRRLEAMRGVSEATQRALLPDPPRRIGPLSIAARYDAAASEARIGGDVYAAQATPYGIRLFIGDVRGKGLGAIGAVAVLLGAFREASVAEPDLPRLADRMDDALDRYKAQAGDEAVLEGFTTGLLAEYTPDGGTLRLVNRGHPPPYLLDADGGVRVLEPATPDVPLGMHGLQGIRSEPDELAVPHGATLLMVTDGVTETRDLAGTFYDPRARLPALGPPATAQDAIDTLRHDLDEWTQGCSAGTDDRAVLAVRRD